MSSQSLSKANSEIEKQEDKNIRQYTFRTRRNRQPLRTLNKENQDQTLDDITDSESDEQKDLITDEDSDWEVEQYKSVKKELIKSHRFSRKKKSCSEDNEEETKQLVIKTKSSKKKKEITVRGPKGTKTKGKERKVKPVIKNFLASASESENDEKSIGCPDLSKSALKQRRITNVHQNLLIDSPQEDKITLKPKRSIIPRIPEIKHKSNKDRAESSIKKFTAKIEMKSNSKKRLSLEKKTEKSTAHLHDKLSSHTIVRDEIPTKIDIISRCHRRISADETLMSVNDTLFQENIPCSTFVEEDNPNMTFSVQEEETTPLSSNLPEVDSEKVRKNFANIFSNDFKTNISTKEDAIEDLTKVEDKLRTFCISESTILPEKTPDKGLLDGLKLNENTTTWISENSAKPKILVNDTPEDNYKNTVIKDRTAIDMASVNDSFNDSECQQEIITEKKSDISSVIGTANGLQSSDRSDSITTAKSPTKITPLVTDCVKSWIHDELAEVDENKSNLIVHEASSDKKKDYSCEKTFIILPNKPSPKTNESTGETCSISENKEQSNNHVLLNNPKSDSINSAGDKSVIVDHNKNGQKELTENEENNVLIGENTNAEITTDLKHSCKVENLNGRKLIKAKSVLSSTRTSPIMEAVLQAEKQKASKPPVPDNNVPDKKGKKKKSKKLTKEDVLSMHIFSSDDDCEALKVTLEESRSGRESDTQKTQLEVKSISLKISTTDSVELSRLSIKSESSRNESKLSSKYCGSLLKDKEESFESSADISSSSRRSEEKHKENIVKGSQPVIDNELDPALIDESPISSGIKDLHQATSSGVSTRSSCSRVFSSEKKESAAVFLLSDSDDNEKVESNSDSDLEPTVRRVVRRIDFEESDDSRTNEKLEISSGNISENEEIKRARDNLKSAREYRDLSGQEEEEDVSEEDDSFIVPDESIDEDGDYDEEEEEEEEEEGEGEKDDENTADEDQEDGDDEHGKEGKYVEEEKNDHELQGKSKGNYKAEERKEDEIGHNDDENGSSGEYEVVDLESSDDNELYQTCRSFIDSTSRQKLPSFVDAEKQRKNSGN
ncbi:DgyrCDS3782 [Dimorphilus gyrociliatus]|uniref:DgyrCDS3782 n=1 Tax=Dimorphilus gyrociliatus TaxID=2664684 RepID=A0A7I8VH50_9ANNE|nr:DgyrCDS3782 [Dimorphilus gyrociliatus]